MPLIKLKKQGAIQNEEPRRHVGVDETLPDDGVMSTLTLDAYLEKYQGRLPNDQKVGVRLSPEDDVARLEAFLESLPLIEVSFPKYVDGRGFSQAQLLRRRYQYDGEICAVGQVLRDEIDKMVRCGFDAFDLAIDRDANVDVVLAEASRYQNVYQPSANQTAVIFNRRNVRAVELAATS